MNGKALSRCLLKCGILLAFFWVPAVLNAQEADVPGSADDSEIGRFAGSAIAGYDAQEFDVYTFRNGAYQTGDEAANTESLEGAIRQIAYIAPEGASMAEVFRNFENEILAAGYERVYTCRDKSCGGTKFGYALERLPLPKMIVDPFSYMYLGARKSGDGVIHTVALVVSKDSHKRARAQLTLVQSGELENKMVDAKAMADGLREHGHIALYNILFDTDKADLKAESKPALEQIARLLGDHPGLNIILVGHTDTQGSLGYNQTLSERRAKAVVAVLISDFGIEPGRLDAAGVGYLAPVASNDSEAGRALNRRVELVKSNRG